jgi:hypothetical protein
MKKTLILFIRNGFYSVAPAQTKAGGATIPNTVSFEGEKLVLNGVGVREKFWMDMYAGALYLNAGSSNANTIMNAMNLWRLKFIWFPS